MRDGRQIVEKNKRQGIAFSKTPTPENVEKSRLRVTQTPGICTTLREIDSSIQRPKMCSSEKAIAIRNGKT